MITEKIAKKANRINRARRAAFKVALEGHLEYLKSISPRDFELKIANLFDALGYTSIVTNFVNDGGRDIEIESADGEITYVECKQLKKGSVGRPVAQKLLGAMAENDIDNGILVTTASFSANVTSMRPVESGRLRLIDGEDLLALMNEAYPPIEITDEFKTICLQCGEIQKQKINESSHCKNNHKLEAWSLEEILNPDDVEGISAVVCQSCKNTVPAENMFNWSYECIKTPGWDNFWAKSGLEGTLDHVSLEPWYNEELNSQNVYKWKRKKGFKKIDDICRACLDKKIALLDFRSQFINELPSSWKEGKMRETTYYKLIEILGLNFKIKQSNSHPSIFGSNKIFPKLNDKQLTKLLQFQPLYYHKKDITAELPDDIKKYTDHIIETVAYINKVENGSAKVSLYFKRTICGKNYYQSSSNNSIYINVNEFSKQYALVITRKIVSNYSQEFLVHENYVEACSVLKGKKKYYQAWKEKYGPVEELSGMEFLKV